MAHIDEFTLNEYLDDALPEVERRDVAAHLADCASCQAAFTDMQQLFLALDSVAEAPFTVDVSAAVESQIEQEKAVSSEQFSVNSGLLLFELAAAAVLLFLLWPAVQAWLLAARSWQTKLLVNITWPQPISWAEINEGITAVTSQLQAYLPTTPFSELAAMQWGLLIGAALIIWLAGSRLIFTNDSGGSHG